jgi:menaquinone reductase, multiheme cytochrome c subunit
LTIRGSLPFLAGVLVAMGVGWVGFPHVIYEKKLQPVAFNHKVHMGEKAGMKCEDCHSFRGDGSFAGIPRLAQCAACHAAALGTSKAEKVFVEQYVTPNREPQWLVYSRQPENVYFPHVVHVKQGKLACEKCHGKHGETETLRVYERDRISGYSRDIWGRPVQKAFLRTEGGMRMDDCVACHRQNKLSHSCMECHK